MKKLLLSLFFCGATFAQLQDIPGTEAIGVSRQKIVDNFNYLNAGKATATIGSALPSNCTYDPAGPVAFFINTTGPMLNVCVATNTWAQLIGGGGSASWGQIAGALANQADLAAALAQKAGLVHGHAQSEITGLVAALAGKEWVANKGQPNGYAPLDSSGKVPSTNLPATSAANWGTISGNLGDQADLGAALSGKEPANANIQQHIASTGNPHATTKAQVGLGNVTNDAQLKIVGNLADLSNVPSARTNLGLGGAAILNIGTTAGTAAAGDHLHDSRYSQTGHAHAAGDVSSGLLSMARLAGSGTCDSTTVLYGDQVCRIPPGSSGGEANTASNQGTVGVGVFKSKLGVDLGFHKLHPASARISIALDGTGDHIDFDVAEAQINHQNLNGVGTNSHVQIDTHLGATNNPHPTTCNQVGAPCTASTYNNPGWITGLAWSKLSSIPSSFNPSAHSISHGSGQSDAITIAESQVTNLTADLAAKVPTSRQVNGHALSADVTVSKSDIGLGNVPDTDATNAANISSGTLPSARLPNPAASSKGGVYSISCAAGQHVSAISSTDGAVTCSADSGGGGHTQNTDTGTASITFQLDSGNSGPKLKNNAGTLELRNATDTAYAPMHASEFQSGNGTTAGAVLMNEVSPGTDFRAWKAPDTLTASLYMRFPDALPTAGDTLIFGAPSGGISQITFGKLSAIQYIAGGTADDTAAVTAAASTAGVYYFQPGATYTISTTSLADGVTFICNGATLKHRTGNTTYLLSINGNKKAVLDGCIFDINGQNITTADQPLLIGVLGGATLEIKNSKWLNSGASQSGVGALFVYQSTVNVHDSEVMDTIQGTSSSGAGQFWISSVPARGVIRIERNKFHGGAYKQIYVLWGDPASEYYIHDNYFENVQAQPGSTGQTGNAFNTWQTGGKISLTGNHFYHSYFSDVRIAGSAVYGVISGNLSDGCGETCFWSETPSSIGGDQALTISDNTFINGGSGIANANIAPPTGNRPISISNNHFSNMKGECIRVENAVVTGNVCSTTPIGVTVGSGNTGYGNIVQANTFDRVTVPIAVSPSLVDPPNNQVGLNNFQGSGTNGEVMVAGGLAPLNAVNYCTITGITKDATGAVVSYVPNATDPNCTNPVNGNVVLLASVAGMVEINGRLCTASSSSAGHFKCSGLNSSGFGEFSTNAPYDGGAQAFILYSSGTTFANSFPATLAQAQHTQNTDTGTSFATFQIHSASSGPKLKNNAGVLEARNSADNDYADVKVKSLTTTGTGPSTEPAQAASSDTTGLSNGQCKTGIDSTTYTMFTRCLSSGGVDQGTKKALAAVPAPSALTLGGVIAYTGTSGQCTSGQHADGFNTDGTPHCTADIGSALPTNNGNKVLATPADGSSGTVAARVLVTADLPGQYYCEPSSTTSNAYTCAPTNAPTAYIRGEHYFFRADVANTGAATINLSSLGAKTIKKPAGGITTDLAANDIRVGQQVEVVYDGTNMQMVSQLANGTAPSDIGTLTYNASGTTTFNAAYAPVAGAVVTATHSTATTFSPTNLVKWGTYRLVVKQDTTGGGVTFTLGTAGACSAWKVTGGGSGAVTLSSAANAQDELHFTYDGTTCRLTVYSNQN